MFDPNILFKQLRNDEEALVIISALGISIAEWPFIKNIGGPLKALCSDLFIKIILNKISVHPYLVNSWLNLRDDLDKFYEYSGFLCTPLSHPNARLFKIIKSPIVFFGRHNSSLIESGPHVAIVGSRQACEQGLRLSRNLSANLAQNKINIISGGALGVDREAHRGALEKNGTTCVVSGVACNLLDKANLFKNYDQKNLVIIYPFGPFFPQGKYMFVERNKFVVALADALIIIQGCEGSGTLHTARFARELKIPVYALPGALDNPRSWVPNRLLQSGHAKALVDFDQIVEALMTKAPKPSKKHKKVEEAGPIESLPEVLELIKSHGNSLSMSEIVALSGKSFLVMQKELLEYELNGRVIKQGAQFVLTGR